MAWKFDSLHNNEVLRVTTGGTMILADHVAMIEDAAAEAERAGGLAAFLLDHRNAKIAMSVMNFYYLPEVNHVLGMQRRERVALLFADHATLDARLYEARSKILGLDHRVFTDVDDAVRWLLRRAPHLHVPLRHFRDSGRQDLEGTIVSD
jgi:hypothetical protein